jgi:hypothetical protein
MDFDIASKVAGVDRNPGLGRIWYAELGDFDTLAGVYASPSTQAEKVTIDGDHTFTGTEGFRLMYTTAEKRSLETSVVGEEDSKGKMVDISAFFPGTDEEFEAFLLDDPDLICIVEPFPCNGTKKLQVGTACAPAKIVEDSYKSGTIKEGVKGYEFKIRAYQGSLLFYPGTITEPSA